MVLELIMGAYEYAWSTKDPRVNGYFLMSSIKPMILLMISYHLMVHYGPKIMEKRKAWNMKWFMIIYNFAIVILNIYVTINFLIGIIRSKYNWICDIPDINATDEEEMRIVNMVHIYTVSKLIEWLDTFCFIVRKKNEQLSFLHVYHHSTMAIFCWVGTRWKASGLSCFPMLLNSIVHIVMYTYYGLAAFGPRFQKYLWWKQYLTIMQLIQFTTGFLHLCYTITTGCKFTRWLLHLSFFYAISYLVLFGIFYKSTYIQNKKPNFMKTLEKDIYKSEVNATDSKQGARKRVISTSAVSG